MKVETGKQQKNVQETKRHFSHPHKVKDINKALDKITERERERTQITNMGNEIESITTESIDLKKIIKYITNNLCPHI